MQTLHAPLNTPSIKTYLVSNLTHRFSQLARLGLGLQLVLVFTMDAALRQSKAMCPFMMKATAAGLRAMTTAARPPLPASPCGGTISKLQVLARRCPVMGKAMAVQSARLGHTGLAGSVAGVATLSSLSGHAKSTKAKLHTGRAHEAQPVEATVFRDKSELKGLKPENGVNG